MKHFKIIILIAVAAIILTYGSASKAAMIYTERPPAGGGFWTQYCAVPSGFYAGARIVLQKCDANKNAQQWLMRLDGSLYTYDDMCMDVDGSSAKQGTPVQLWPCNGSAAQSWQYSMGALKSFGGSVLCLDIPGNNTYEGAELWIWLCNGSDAQDWKIY